MNILAYFTVYKVDLNNVAHYDYFVILFSVILSALIVIKFTYIWEHRFQFSLLFIAVIIILIIVGHINQQKTFKIFFEEFGNPYAPFYIVNMAIALAGFATAIFTWWKNNINQRISLTQEITRQDKLFAKAAELLNNKNDLITRKNGVHILKDLAITSISQSQKCIDVLCSLNDSWMPDFLNKYEDFFINNTNFLNEKNIKDFILYFDEEQIDADGNPKRIFTKILEPEMLDNISLYQSIISSISYIIKVLSNNKNLYKKIDLSYKYLNVIKLNNIKLNKLNFESSHLQSADFEDSILNKCIFISTKLENANMMSAKLNSANFIYSKLNNTNFAHANLKNANISKSKIFATSFFNSKLSHANLYNTNLINPDLERAIFKKTNFKEAKFQFIDTKNPNFRNTIFKKTNFTETKFDSANLEGVDFTKAILTRTDFRKAEKKEKAYYGDNEKDAIFTDVDYYKHYPIK